jgi:type VI secretion system secreted protein VgrG
MATPITQQNRLLKIYSDLDFDVLLIDSFSGVESISRPFRFDVKLLADVQSGNQNKVVGEKLLGKSMAIEVELNKNQSRILSGVVTHFAIEGIDKQFAYYHAILVPWFSLLDYGTDCRIFQDKTVPQIIEAMIQERGMQKYYRSDLVRTYTSWDYCVQYNESDFAFLSRIMEAEGIYYYFEHKADHTHTLVLADRPDAHKPCPNQNEFRYNPDAGIGDFDDTISSWKTRVEFLSGNWTFRDYHLEMPRNRLEVTEKGVNASDVNSHLEVFYYPGEYAKKFNEPDKRVSDIRPEGEKLVRESSENVEKNWTVVEGSSHARPMATGFTLKVIGGAGLQTKGEFLLTSIRHSALQHPDYVSTGRLGEGYLNQFACIPSKVQFRPARITPRPIVSGPQTAFVIDENPEPKEEIWPDQYGRVRVRFPWDREAKYACWIRVVQQWAGKGWGYQWVPRVGDEVMVAFLHGDPDCPIIVGSVYNHENMPPFALPDNKTQSGIKTRSSPNGTSDNYNLFRFEDKKGHEDVLLHAERTMHNSVEASQFITVGGDRHITTGGIDKDGNQVGDVKEKVFKNHNLHVLKDARDQVEGKEMRTIVGDSAALYQGSRSVQIISDELVMAQTITFQAEQTITLMSGASSIVIDPSGVTIVGLPAINLNPMAAMPPTPPVMPSVDPPDDP